MITGSIAIALRVNITLAPPRHCLLFPQRTELPHLGAITKAVHGHGRSSYKGHIELLAEDFMGIYYDLMIYIYMT
jgi:hypothetical protein